MSETFKSVGSQVDFPEMERRVLELWDRGDTFARSVSTRSTEKPTIALRLGNRERLADPA